MPKQQQKQCLPDRCIFNVLGGNKEAGVSGQCELGTEIALGEMVKGRSADHGDDLGSCS